MMEKDINVKFMEDLFLGLYFDENVPNEDVDSKNKYITNINVLELRSKLEQSWVHYLQKNEDLWNFQAVFGENLRNWHNQMNELAKIETDEDMLKFVQTNCEANIQLGYKLGDVSGKDIKNLISYQKPQASVSFQGKHFSVNSFKLFNFYQLHLTLHLLIDSLKDESFIFTPIFSLWFDSLPDPYTLDTYHIHTWYSSHNLGDRAINFLKSRNYTKADLFSIENFNPSELKASSEGKNDWPSGYPEIFITYTKKILNVNPRKIVAEIVNDIKSIYLKLTNYKKKELKDPQSIFDNLNQELKLFYNKGKELFLNLSEIVGIESSVEEGGRLERGTFEKSKEKLPLQTIILLFHKAFEVDLNQKKPISEAGYRTRKSLFDEFLNKDTRKEKYNYIKPVSKGTLYSVFEKYSTELNAILEVNPEMGAGGGDAYRIVKPELQFEEIKEKKSLQENKKKILVIKEKIHFGLINYEERNYTDAISIFNDLLLSNIHDLSEIRSDYLGILYYLGKSYMKNGLFAKAQDQFKTIFKIDENKYDSRYRLVECLYEMREFAKAGESALSLYKNLKRILEPYSSLNKSYKEILYEEIISYFPFELDKFHPNLSKIDIFSKFLVIVNRSPYRLDLFHLRPKYQSNWEEYQEKMKEFKELKYYIGINISLYRKLKLIQLNTQKYLIEIYRRLITDIFFEDKRDDFFSYIDEVLTTLLSLMSGEAIESDILNNFLIYLDKLSRLYYRQDKNLITILINKKFGEISNKLKRGSFPERTYFVTYFLYASASLINSDNYFWVYRDLHNTLDRPELEIELFCIELYQIKKIVLPMLEKDFQSKLSNANSSINKEISEQFQEWKYDISLVQYLGIREFKSTIQKYITMAQEQESQHFEHLISKLSVDIEQKFNEVKALQSKGRKQAFNQIFSQLVKSFKPIIVEKIIDYSIKPEKFNYRQFPLKISNEVFSLLHEHIGEVKLIITLFNQEISTFIYNELKRKITEPNSFHLDLENQTIYIHKYKETDFKGNELLFEKYLDYFFIDFLDNFKFNTDKLVLRYPAEIATLLDDYFMKQFLIDTENPFFEFSIDHNALQRYYFIQINKKEVK